MWTIPAIPSGAHDIDVHRPERPARPANDPDRRSDRRRSARHGGQGADDEFEIDTFEPRSEDGSGE